MATLGSSNFGIFQTNQQEFQEGQLPSEETHKGSTYANPQEKPSCPKYRKQSINVKLHSAQKLIPKFSHSTSSTGSEERKYLSKKTNECEPAERNKFRSSEKNGVRKNGETYYNSHSMPLAYPPPYGYPYGYPPHPSLYLSPRQGQNFAEKRQQKFVEAHLRPQSNYQAYSPQLEYYRFGGSLIPPLNFQGFNSMENYQMGDLNDVDGICAKMGGEGMESYEAGENKYYNQKQKNNNNGVGEREKSPKLDLKEVMEPYQRYFKPQQWNNLKTIMQQLVAQNNNGFQLLFNFLEKQHSTKKIRKTIKVFEILTLLNSQAVIDQLIQEERTRRQKQSKCDPIKVLLRHLTRPLKPSR